jgi:hypothetical protein
MRKRLQDFHEDSGSCFTGCHSAESIVCRAKHVKERYPQINHGRRDGAVLHEFIAASCDTRGLFDAWITGGAADPIYRGTVFMFFWRP